MNTFPIMLGTLCVFALAYRYYSAFIAAKVLVLDDRRTTPAHTYEDGHNYVPSPKWVLFGHHFATIAGAAHWSVQPWQRNSASRRGSCGSPV
jgi:carbon starvation protein